MKDVSYWRVVDERVEVVTTDGLTGTTQTFSLRGDSLVREMNTRWHLVGASVVETPVRRVIWLRAPCRAC
jgi:hypothetical protein